MARAVLASVLLQRLREATDTQNDTHVSDAELYRALTSAVAVTWGKIIANGIGGEAVRCASFTTVAGTANYPISSVSVSIDGGAPTNGIADFFAVDSVMVDDGAGAMRPISHRAPQELHAYRPVGGVYPIKLYYYPCAPTFSTGAESFDGINGWEEHTIQTAALHIKGKKFDDTAPFRTRIRELEADMETLGDRNRDEPPRVVRRSRVARLAARTAPFNANVTAWCKRGDNLELYYNFSSYGVL